MMSRTYKIIIALGCILFIPGCFSTSQQFELSGTRWLLQSMHGQELLGDTAITLKITEGGISGSSGCNLYGAKYTTRPKDGIEIDEVAHTDMACYEPAGILEQEEEYIGTIQEATSYSLDDENLIMLDEQGNILLKYRLLPKFEANPEGLIGKTWRLNYADSMEEYELGAFTLWFDGSMIGGTTSCRDYEGAYQPVEDGIQVTMLRMKTDVECSKTELLAEEIYTSLLERIDQYNVSQNRLELYTVQNDRLIFELTSKISNRNTAYPIDTNTAQTTQIYPEPFSASTSPLSDSERAIYALLAQYGWTISRQISTHSETLPETFQHEPGDFPYAIYWAYNNEFNKEIEELGWRIEEVNTAPGVSQRLCIPK
jgi:heat shock protein HslJ